MVTAADQRVQQRVIGMMRLQPHIAALARAAGASRHLDQLLRQFLARAEIGGEQALVHADHGHPGEMRQIVALGQDLRAHQDAGHLAQLRQLLRQAVALLRGAAIHAQHRHGRELFGQQFLQPLGADALRLQRQAAAIGAGRGRRLPRAAVVALQPPAARMHRHGTVAALAVRAPAAVVA